MDASPALDGGQIADAGGVTPDGAGADAGAPRPLAPKPTPRDIRPPPIPPGPLPPPLPAGAAGEPTVDAGVPGT
jgi:hypothetical protein